MIDWKKHDNATCVSVTHFDSNGDTISTSWADRPAQTKTVADAVEWNEKVFKSKEWKNDKCGYITLYANSFSYSSSKNSGDLVCTRAEFEAYVKEQEGEKWTHITNSGYKCKIMVGEPDENYVIVVLCSDGVYRLHDLKTLKPIKPTLTKADCELLLKFKKHIVDSDKCRLDDMLDDFLDKYNII